MPKLTPIRTSAPCIKKLDRPILTPADMPYESTLVFNAGVTKFNGKYIMVFRNDYGTNPEKFLKERCFPATSIGVAISDNGIDNWEVRPFHLFDSPKTKIETNGWVGRYYDPRITVIEGKPYLCMASDSKRGIQGVIAEVDDNFEKVNIISYSAPNNRNMVLFPEKIGGMYVRLERPMAMYSDDAYCFDIWCSKSPDLKYWGEIKNMTRHDKMPFSNDKMGPAAPPVKTEKGWLATFHCVETNPEWGKNGWEPQWCHRYMAGIMLLDLEDPSKILGMYKKPLLAPDMPYETDEGFRQNTIFPGGMILEDDGEVKIYYGASDAYECMCTAHVDDLIKLCLETNN